MEEVDIKCPYCPFPIKLVKDNDRWYFKISPRHKLAGWTKTTIKCCISGNKIGIRRARKILSEDK